MKNKILIIGVLTMVLSFVGSTYAAGQGQGGPSGIHEPGTGLENPELKEENQGTGQGLQDDDEIKNEIQNLNQVRNQGEEDQIKNREQEEVQDKKDDGSMIAEQRRSQVANAVQEMLKVADRNGGIGQQVKVIAQNQNQNQEKIEESLKKAQDRSAFAKFIVGPNYGEINKAKKLLDQNREQIKELNQVKNQLIYQGDQQALTQQIQTLEKAALEIENSLGMSEKGFSVLGWMFRMFSK